VPRSRVVPTIKEVAARAGVSIATVSRALNGAGATEQTIERVRAAAAELKFRPNLLGRALKTAQLRSIGVLVPSLANPVFAGSAGGVEDAARAAGYAAVVASSHYDPSRESAAVDLLLSNRVAGLVLTVADADASLILDSLDAEGVPYVLLYNQPSVAGRGYAAVDNVAAAREATQHLIGQGHRRVAMIAGELRASDRSRLRHRGYRAAMEAAGLEPLPLFEIGFEEKDFAQRLDLFLRANDPVTGAFCSNDMLALAAIAALRTLGRRVPEDISVIGVDGIDVGTLVSPRLATIVQPTHEMGAAAFELLLSRLDGDRGRASAGQPGHRILPHTLRSGESVAAIPQNSSAVLRSRC
jgi:DNA-binding LacI/PurR family transcriptional regulator